MFCREVGKVVRVVGEVSKAARSAMRRAGRWSMVPRREMRRPAWSEERSRVRVNFGIRSETGEVVDVMMGWWVGVSSLKRMVEKMARIEFSLNRSMEANWERVMED